MLHLHHCIYFADLGIKKKMLFFVLFSIDTRHIKSSVTLCQKSTMSNLKTDFFFYLNRHLSPDLTHHQKPHRIHCCSSILDEQIGSSSYRDEILTSNFTQLYHHQWKAIRFIQPLCIFKTLSAVPRQ